MGRPTIMTKETVNKLIEVFKIGANDTEACNHANISRETFYKHLKADENFADEVESAKNWPILAMKKVIVKAAVEGDKQAAQWYLERKKKDEFAQRTELTGNEGVPLGYVYSSDIKEIEKGKKQLTDNTNAVQIPHQKIQEVQILPPGSEEKHTPQREK